MRPAAIPREYFQIDVTTHPWNSLRYADQIRVTKGDTLNLKCYAKYLGATANNNYGILLRMTLFADYQEVEGGFFGQPGFFGNIYSLVNSIDSTTGLRGATWRKDRPDESSFGPWAKDDFFFVLAPQNSTQQILDTPGMSVNRWYEYDIEIPNCPGEGFITFDIHGLCKWHGKTSNNFPDMKTKWDGVTGKTRYMKTPRDGEFTDSGGTLPKAIITGVELNRIADPNEFAPSQAYIYENPTEYSQEIEPKTVYNGDELDDNHISTILVPTNTTGLKNFWDTIDGKYGLSSIGLVTVKSIMNLYIQPFRLLEGVIKSEDVDIDTRFEFEALPGLKWVLQRATFNEKYNYIEDATWFQISDVEIPAGGTEGFNSLEPQWSSTGDKRCIQTGSPPTNTGFVEELQVDNNPNSPTYGQLRWQSTLQTNIFGCPIGEPTKYFWGCQDLTLDPDELQRGTFSEDLPGEITCPFTNEGGEYIYFVHLQSIGLVQSVQTSAQPEIISDFQYLADITYLGFLYKVYRQNYVTEEFSDFSITFKFNP